MPRYFIQLSYKGTRYNGWQAQLNTPHTIQQELQEKLGMVLREAVEITGCGRTDTGVHARDYYAHFDSGQSGLEDGLQKYIHKFNQVLPHDIAIKNILPVKDDANSRFDATSRTYHYQVHLSKDPFLNEFSCYLSSAPDFEAMNTAAGYLCTITDFTSFSKLNPQAKNNDCNVTDAKWVKVSEHQWYFTITANRFLRNMVRAIVGTLLEIGKGRLTFSEFKTIISNKNRSDAGVSVPAQGLFLTHIIYPETIFN